MSEEFEHSSKVFDDSLNSHIPEERMLLPDPFSVTTEELDQEARRQKFISLHIRPLFRILLSAGVITGATFGGIYEYQVLSRPDINVSGFPNKLPEAVEETIPNAVQLNNFIYTENGHGGFQFSGGKISSAVILNSEYAISAGHTILGDNGMNLAAKGKCQELVLGYYDSAIGKGVAEPVNKYDASYQGEDETSTPDIALLQQTKTLVKTQGKVRPLKINDSSLHIGERLYFINYQTTPHSQLRDPLLNRAQTIGNHTTINKLAFPAIYGGIYIGKSDAGYLNVLTGEKSYGVINDPYDDLGGSGGLVETSSGQLVGVLDNAHPLGSANYYDDYVEVNIKGNRPNQQFSLAAVQPVTKQILSSLTTGLHPDKACK